MKNILKFLGTSIRLRVILFFGVFFITITASYLLTAAYFQSLEKYQFVLNIAGRNGNLLQQIVLLSHQVAREQKNARNFLIEDINLVSLNLKLLKEGGVTNFEGRKITLAPCEKEILPVLNALEKNWIKFKKDADQVSEMNAKVKAFSKAEQGIIWVDNPKLEAIIKNLESQTDELLYLNDQFIDLYFELIEERKDNADTFLLVLLFINGSFIIIGFLLLRQNIFIPFDKIVDVAEKIGQGDLTQKINFNTQNEVGEVADALNRLVDKIRNATDFIKNIETGNLTVQYENEQNTNHELDNDTLAMALISMRGRLQEVAVEEAKRQWTTQGLALFAQILQKNNDNIENLSFEFVINIVSYTKSAQGALFIVNREDEQKIHLYMSACYAYERKRLLDKKIVSGEGLVGQAFKDGDVIYMTEIPDDFTEITSGLGGSRPNSILVVPLKLNEVVYGVLELASFYAFEAYQVDFLKRLGENIAATINSVQNTDRTRRLLEESKQITLQMQKQEREMKENMLELQLTQDQMRRNQELLSAQSYAINTSLIYVEIDMEGNILNCNQIFANVLEYLPQFLVQRKYQSLVYNDNYAQQEFENLWLLLKSGKPVIGSYKRVTANGAERWIRATYSPIKGIDGKPYKIIEIGFDVTAEKSARLDFQEQLASFKRFTGWVEFDTEKNIRDTNQIFTQLLLTDSEQLIAQNYDTIFQQEQAESEELWGNLLAGEYQQKEIALKLENDETLWLQCSFNPILDLEGKPNKVVCFVNNITTRKRNEEVIRLAQIESQARQSNLVAIINNTEDIILTLNSQYQITLFNEIAAKTFEEIGTPLYIGMHVAETFPESKFNEFTAYYEKAFTGEQFAVEEFLYNPKTYNATLYAMIFYPTYDDQHNQNGIAVFLRNFAEKKKQEKEMDKLKRQIDAQKKTIDRLEKERKEIKETLKNKDQEIETLKNGN
ncbi:MAG: PAS domain S-box protein [Cytophagales bacterium]|nr:MAG: PAS domain S-box protein [Cytophagales bacterium]